MMVPSLFTGRIRRGTLLRQGKGVRMAAGLEAGGVQPISFRLAVIRLHWEVIWLPRFGRYSRYLRHG
jgi:hypothetical protein